MISAIASSTFPNTYSNPGHSVGALSAELQRYQKQLSDCVNCASANTPESKTKAQNLSDKIAAIKAQIDKAGSATVSQNYQATDNSSQNNPVSSTSTIVGNNVNVFA